MNKFLRWIFLVYFITHIPITIFIDLQGAFGQFYPAFLRNLVLWYVREFGDFLMGSSPPWYCFQDMQFESNVFL
jgi:hypothetical protein